MKYTMINLLTCDPGSANFGFAVTKGRVSVVNGQVKIQFRTITSGLCPCPINKVKDTKDLRAKQLLFTAWFNKILKDYEITAVGIERFQARGLLGSLGEFIGIMIGLMLSCTEGMSLKVYTAATWKNAVRRSTGDPEWLKDLYKMAKVPPHQVDACLMGAWLLHQGYGVQDYGDIDLVKKRNQFLDRVEETSQTKLVNRRIKR